MQKSYDLLFYYVMIPYSPDCKSVPIHCDYSIIGVTKIEPKSNGAVSTPKITLIKGSSKTFEDNGIRKPQIPVKKKWISN
jgi:hypothetical protein